MTVAEIDAEDGLGSAVLRQRRGAVVVLSWDRRPANALDCALIADLSAAVSRAAVETGVRALILMGAGAVFSAGLAAEDLGQIATARALSALTRQIEGLGLTVIAALHGSCLGAGLELAMAAHWRVAAEATRCGLPEINLGLGPAAGASQRLPRLVGGRQALRLLTTGAVVDAAEALALGLVDEVASGDLLAAALALAARDPGPRRSCDLVAGLSDLFGPGGAVAEARMQMQGHRLPGPGRMIDCVEAAGLLPFEQGLQVEATAFADLAASSEARGLRQAFVSQRRAGQPPRAVAALGAVKFDHLGLWAPPEGVVEWLVRALGAGLSVTIGAETREALVAILNRVAAQQDALVASGSLSELARDADWARLTPCLDAERLGACDLVLAGPDAPAGLPVSLCVRPGGLPKGAEGLALTLPDKAGGPAEVAMSAGADPVLAARALALARRVGARAVFTGPGGPVEARLRRALGQALAGLEHAGHDRAQVTAALAAFGLGTGHHRLPPMPPGGPDLVRACMAALAAEGGRMLDEGAALRPGDIDAVALHAGLVPRWEGGPMAWADRLGLLVLRADLRARARHDPVLYATPAAFDRLIMEGRTLVPLPG